MAAPKVIGQLIASRRFGQSGTATDAVGAEQEDEQEIWGPADEETLEIR